MQWRVPFLTQQFVGRMKPQIFTECGDPVHANAIKADRTASQPINPAVVRSKQGAFSSFSAAFFGSRRVASAIELNRALRPAPTVSYVQFYNNISELLRRNRIATGIPVQRQHDGETWVVGQVLHDTLASGAVPNKASASQPHSLYQRMRRYIIDQEHLTAAVCSAWSTGGEPACARFEVVANYTVTSPCGKLFALDVLLAQMRSGD
jgi:hypothetical protein